MNHTTAIRIIITVLAFSMLAAAGTTLPTLQQGHADHVVVTPQNNKDSLLFFLILVASDE
jgi:hypothetical protein